MNQQTNTCQICARVIKANTGVIAHHGYQRPGDGWQTASCAGARYLPYEVSCDRLPPTIEVVKNFITLRSQVLKEFVENPPETLTVAPHYIGDRRGGTVLNRPEGFDPEKDVYTGYQSYESEYKSQRYQIEKSIKQAKADLEFLQKRLADWIPPKVNTNN